MAPGLFESVTKTNELEHCLSGPEAGHTHLLALQSLATMVARFPVTLISARRISPPKTIPVVPIFVVRLMLFKPSAKDQGTKSDSAAADWGSGVGWGIWVVHPCGWDFIYCLVMCHANPGGFLGSECVVVSRDRRRLM